MLILTRKAVEGDDELLIGKDVSVKILSNKDGWIRIGITAPKEISVLRAEIADKYEQRGEVA